MKRIIFASILFFVSVLSFGQSLYISQYIETNSGTIPKGLEIFNNTGSDIILSSSNYLVIYQGTNGGSCSELSSTKVTNGTLRNGEVWVIGTSDLTSYAVTNGANLSGTTTYNFAFNGDDALELYLGTTLQDVFGTCGSDPGSSWSGNGVSTADQNIQILCGTVATTTSWTDPSVRFETVSTDPLNDLTGFGNAPSCSPGPEIQLQQPVGTDVACGYTYDFGTQTTNTNTTLTIRIKNTGTSDLTISSYSITGTDAADFTVTTAPATIVSAGSSTDMVITFNATVAGTKTAKLTINNDDSDESACEINFTAVAQDPCSEPSGQATSLVLSNITTNSIDGSYTEPSPIADSYLVIYSTNSTLSSNPVDGNTYSPGDAIGGGIVVNNITGTSFTASGLTSGTEYYFFIFANNNNSCTGGPNYNITSPLTGNEITIPENPSWNTAGCSTNSTIDLSWTAATGNSTGYLLVVRENATPHVITGLDPTTNLNENTDYSIAAQFGSTLEYSRILYKGTATSVTITNLPTANCTFKLYTFTIGANGTDYVYSTGTQQTNTISVSDVSSESATCGDSQSSIAWANPNSSCFDEVLIVANETSGIGFSPSGDGTAYTANTVYSAPDQVVYKGTGSSVAITNLTNGTTYYFEIFVRKGTEWSSGVEVSCTPDVVTVLYPGDLAIVAVNTLGTTGDEMSFFAFKDITNGTIIQITDNGYERLTANEWADSEGFINVERTGNTIEAGTVITLIMTAANGLTSADFDIFICGILDDSNWNIYSSGNGSGFNFNPTDQIWMMQNGNWTDPIGDHNATYDGNILYGWTAIGWETAPGYNSTSGSTLPDGTNCFNTNVSVNANNDKVKFFADTSQFMSQAAWIGLINSSGNWTGYVDNASYDAGGLNYSGSCIKFHIDNSLGNGAGTWQGGEDNNWFNCANWLNMTVPDATIDVTILSNAQNEANIDDTQEYAALFGNIAKCKNLTIEDGGDTVYVKIDDANDELQVKENLTLETNSKIYNDNGGTLSIDGNIIINNGALVDMHANITTGATLNLKGNWIDYNTLDNDTLGYYETSGKIIFSGTSQQTIFDATGTENFYDVQINNASGLNLNGNDITISGTLDLSLGNITTGSNNVIINNTATTSVINQSTSSYIFGNIRRYVNSTGSYYFPVGTSTQFEIANITLNSSTGINYIDCKFTNPIVTTDISSLGLTIGGTPVTTMLDYGYWTITPDYYTSIDYDVTITSRGHSNGGTIATQHTVVKRANSSQDWAVFELNHDNSTQSGTGTSAITAKLTNLTSFSDFGIARSDINPLPITLLDFRANAENNYIKLQWITLSEINNDYFTIEKSLNGINFYPINRIDGKGTSNELNKYYDIDYDTESSIIYYRLKQTDFDGNYSYSNIITVNLHISESSISFYNNTLHFNLEENISNRIIITDALGRKYFDKIITLQSDFTVSLSAFDKGIYFVNLINKYENISKKIIVDNCSLIIK